MGNCPQPRLHFFYGKALGTRLKLSSDPLVNRPKRRPAQFSFAGPYIVMFEIRRHISPTDIYGDI